MFHVQILVQTLLLINSVKVLKLTQEVFFRPVALELPLERSAKQWLPVQQHCHRRTSAEALLVSCDKYTVIVSSKGTIVC